MVRKAAGSALSVQMLCHIHQPGDDAVCGRLVQRRGFSARIFNPAAFAEAMPVGESSTAMALTPTVQKPCRNRAAMAYKTKKP